MANIPQDDKKSIIKLAHIYSQEGQWDRALNEYRKILALDPDDMNTHSTLGDIYLKKNLVPAAYEAYMKAVTGFVSRNQIDKAMSVYRKLSKLNASKLMEEGRTKVAFAQHYVKIDENLQAEKFDDAVDMMGKLLKAHADDPVVLAKLLELELMIAQMPPSVLLYQTFGDLFLKHNILDKAQTMFKRISELDTKDKSVRANLAQLHVKQGQESEAKKEYLSLAEEALAENNLDEAVRYAQKAIDLKSVEANYITGIVLFKKQKWNEAKTEFEKLLRIKVNHLGALVHMGKVLDSLGQADKAKEFFHKALMIDKEGVLAQEAWAEFCVKHKEKEAAIPALTVLLDGAVLANQTDRAIKFAKMLVLMEPEAIFPQAKLVQLFQSSGDLKGASEACRALALVYQKSSQYEGAIEYLEKAVELNPEMAGAVEKTLTELRQKVQPPVLETPPEEVQQTLIAEPVLVEEVKAEITPEPIQVKEMSGEVPEPPILMEEEKDIFTDPLPGLESLLKTETQKPVESNILPMMPDPLEAYTAELQTAEMCIKQGLLKAAIDIYHQLLETDPSLNVIRQKLNEVNAVYLKKWMESKVIKAPVQPNPFLISPPSFEKKTNTNW